MLMLIVCVWVRTVCVCKISIHLMLMLIKNIKQMYCYLVNFNTSHVNVNLANALLEQLSKSHFNTSHVNVNQKKVD